MLAARHNVNREFLIEMHDQLVFDRGKGVHWTLQNHVLPRLGCLVGMWNCKRCGVLYGGPSDWRVRPDSCICCQEAKQNEDDTSFEYVEQQFRDETYRVTGHPDGFLVLPSMPGHGVLEGKSASDRKFQDVQDVPDFGHVIQLQAYLWLTGL